jgi:hypothetical protein
MGKDPYSFFTIYEITMTEKTVNIISVMTKFITSFETPDDTYRY